MLLDYLIVFAVGGAVCLLGQLLINYTKMTTARILVIFLLLGVALEAVGIFEPLKEFAKAGITVPITGFGSSLAKGAMEGVKTDGVLGALTGGLRMTAAGIGASVFLGFVVALFSNAKTKK